MADLRKHEIGWVGTGRMGFSMAARLLKKGARVTAWNRTRAKAEPLATLGAQIGDSPAALADRDIVFTMVSGSDDLLEHRLDVVDPDIDEDARVARRPAAAHPFAAHLRGRIVERGRSVVTRPRLPTEGALVEPCRSAFVGRRDLEIANLRLPHLATLMPLLG